jgi:hypothetical protein
MQKNGVYYYGTWEVAFNLMGVNPGIDDESGASAVAVAVKTARTMRPHCRECWRRPR